MTPEETKQLSALDLRSKILDLESVMRAMPEHQIHIEPKHYFANNLYAREIFIPKGTTLTGKIHKTEHLNVLSLGEVSVYTEDGIKRIKASSVVHSIPGIRAFPHSLGKTPRGFLPAGSDNLLLALAVGDQQNTSSTIYLNAGSTGTAKVLVF